MEARARTRADQVKCVKCLGSGWVCEDHQDRPSEVVIEGGCDCGGAAVPCACNPDAAFEFTQVYATVDPEHEAPGSSGFKSLMRNFSGARPWWRSTLGALT
jgi:hypothetical protein